MTWAKAESCLSGTRAIFTLLVLSVLTMGHHWSKVRSTSLQIHVMYVHARVTHKYMLCMHMHE